MPFFKTSPNLTDGEKARIEFHFQQLAEHLGIAKFGLPVIGEDAILGKQEKDRDNIRVRDFVGHHLGIDVHPIRIQYQPQLPVQKSGGGG